MQLHHTPLAMVSPGIARVHIGNHEEVLALALDLMARTKEEPSGVISDSQAAGKLVEKNSIKTGRMAYFPRMPSNGREAAFFEFLLARARDHVRQAKVWRSVRLRKRPGTGKSTRIEPDDLALERAWAIDQRAGDYQILHNHTPNVVAGIIYLEVPPGINMMSYPDGILNLIETGPFVVMPQPGDMYLWPAWMLHSVYPFRGEGRRVAISFNVLHGALKGEADVYFKPGYTQVTQKQFYAATRPEDI